MNIQNKTASAEEPESFCQPVSAQEGGTVFSWAWSDNIEWVSFSCTDTNSCAEAGGADYGVTIDDSGNFSGYAWSNYIGWIDFSGASHNKATGEVSGWAYILSMANDGLISLRGTASDGSPYGVSIDGLGNFSGFGWNGNDNGSGIGWIDFSPTIEARVKTLAPPKAPKLVKPINGIDVYDLGEEPYISYPKRASLEWSEFPDDDPEYFQNGYQVQASDDADFNNLVLNEATSSSSNAFISDSNILDWNDTYWWRVRVRANNGMCSEWATVGFAGEENNFKTPKHPRPFAKFIYSPADVSAGVEVQFNDDSTCYYDYIDETLETYNCRDNENTQYSWNFGDGATSTDKNPTHTYKKANNWIVGLMVTDEDGYSSGFVFENPVSGNPIEKDGVTSGVSVEGGQGVIEIEVPLPKWRKIIPF